MVFLSSSAFGDPLLFPFVQKTLGRSPDSLRAIVVTSASALSEPGPNAVKTRDALLAYGVVQTAFLDWSAPGARGRLHEADVIVLNGGDPVRLLATARQSDLLESQRGWCDSERAVIGVSAGGMLLSPGLHLVSAFSRILGLDDSDVELADVAGLDLFEEHFFPHFDLASTRVEGLFQRLDELELLNGVRIYRQNNGQTAVVRERVLSVLEGGAR